MQSFIAFQPPRGGAFTAPVRYLCDVFEPPVAKGDRPKRFTVTHDLTQHLPYGLFLIVDVDGREIGRQISRPNLVDCLDWETFANDPTARKAGERRFSYFQNRSGNAANRGRAAVSKRLVISTEGFTLANASRESRLDLIKRAGDAPKVARRFEVSTAAIQNWIRYGIPASKFSAIAEMAARPDLRALRKVA